MGVLVIVHISGHGFIKTIICTPSFCEYEGLFRFSKPMFINPVLESQSIPLERLIVEKAVGMAFQINATYFDQFPSIFDYGFSDIAVRQNPYLKESQEKLKLRHIKDWVPPKH